MDKEQTGLIVLLAAALEEKTPVSMPDGADLARVLQNAAVNGVAALCASAALRLPDAPPSCARALAEAEMADTLRHVALEPVFAAFVEQDVPWCPLKGWTLQALYPQPWLREMSDVDILVRAADLQRAGDILRAHGFSLAFSNEQHDVYTIAPDVCIEVHSKLTSVFDSRVWFTGEAWQLAEPVPDTPDAYRLSPARTLEYAVLHADKHLRASGVGARTVADIYLITHRLCDADALAAAGETLRRLDLFTLYRQLLAIGEAWFAGAPLSPELNDAGAYLLHIGKSGVYKRSALRVMQAGAPKNARLLRLRYLLFETFPDRKQMSLDYKILCRFGILLPFCWIHRILRLLLRDRQAFSEAVRNVSTLSPDDESRYRRVARTLYGSGLNEPAPVNPASTADIFR